MPNKIHPILITAFSVVFLFAGMAFAKPMKIDVIYQARIGNSLKLKPGKYRIAVTKNTKSPAVSFYSSTGKLIGKVPVKVVNTSGKNSYTMIDYNTVASNHIITEISPKGRREGLYFSQPTAGKMNTKK